MLLLVGLLLAGGVSPVLADTDLEVGGLAIIANTNTDSIMVRAGPGYEYTVLTTVEEGDIVTVLDGPIAGDDGNLWYEVDIDGLDGFVFADFLVLPINAPLHPVRRSDASRPVTAAAASGGGGYAATISGTGGDGARLRDSAGLDGAIILTMPEGAAVSVLGEPQAGGAHYWYLVSYDGVRGYVAADFLGGGGTMVAATTATTAPASPRAAVFGSGVHVRVSGTGSDDLRIRGWAGTDGAIQGHAPADAVLLILHGPESDGVGNLWYAVDYDGLSGYVSADFLAWTDQHLSARYAPSLATPAAAPAPPAPAQKAVGFGHGAHVKVSGTGEDPLYIRGWAGIDAGIQGHAPAGAVLLVLGGPESDGAGTLWYPVDYDGLSGYASADYLAGTDQRLSTRQVVRFTSNPAPAAPPPPPAPAPAPAPKAAPAPAAVQQTRAEPTGGGNGGALVAHAMKYLGYPYVYGGSSPAGFDCSGFTLYVVRQVLGRNIGASAAAQTGAGVSVSAKNLEPGDLVFFVNTNGPGITHVGIYIGGGQMIHSGSERTGVVISNIWDGYWGSRYYGARRL